jgi:hypothetical protein
MILVARTAVDPEKMFQSVRAAVVALDSQIPMFDTKTLEDHVGISRLFHSCLVVGSQAWQMFSKVSVV